MLFFPGSRECSSSLVGHWHKERKRRSSVPAQLAAALWHFVQGNQTEWISGINTPEGGKNMKDGPLLLAFSHHKQNLLFCQKHPLLPRDSFHKFLSTIVLLSPPFLSVSCILTLLPFLSTSPSLLRSLAWVPGQMVRGSRCSPPIVSKGKNKGWIQSKQTLLEGAREARGDV